MKDKNNTNVYLVKIVKQKKILDILVQGNAINLKIFFNKNILR